MNNTHEDDDDGSDDEQLWLRYGGDGDGKADGTADDLLGPA